MRSANSLRSGARARQKSFLFTKNFSASRSIDFGSAIKVTAVAGKFALAARKSSMCCCATFLLPPTPSLVSKAGRTRRRSQSLRSGGYGRGELNPCSDVDLMFLHGDSGEEVSPYALQVVRQVLYLLWDIGFKVGHSTRSLDEAIAQANGDMRTKTALLEARFLAGDSDLKRLFRDRFRAECVAEHEREYIEGRMQDQVARHAKFGNSVYMQEPHVKSGCGGLRDYQNLLWMAAFKEGALTTNYLVGNGLAERERPEPD